jgi:hypothetical protein
MKMILLDAGREERLPAFEKDDKKTGQEEKVV